MKWALIWGAWLLAFAVSGAVLEWYALTHPPGGDTLTAQLRALVSRPAVWWPALGASVGATVWAVRHVFWGTA